MPLALSYHAWGCGGAWLDWEGVMAVDMEFCLLGPLVVRRGAVAVPVPRGKQRAVLAALLLSANKPVYVDDLAEVLWGAEPPQSARVTVANYVKRLRYAFGDDGRDRIRTMPHGYSIDVSVSELDVFRFEAMTAGARSAARDGSWAQAAEQARSALSLWRGEPLGDVESEALTQREVPRLASLRLQALETRLDADLHLGRHGDVIPELQQLADAHPLQENLHALLMLALYRSGRQAEAQAVYRQVRHVLREDLGTEPGKEIRELHHRILTADPALTLPVPRPGSHGHLMVVPRELPAAVPHFMGRDSELSALTALAGLATQGTVVISAIDGTAGVGKTALALHWAHQVADSFHDGQLYVNLRGYDPEQPVAAADALAAFLRALGVPGTDIPAGIDERAARYRSLLAGRRLLVMLDNAGSAEQVRSLLPGTPGCVAVVTSRDSLAGLVAREGARRLDLDLLPLPDAVNLLRALIGARVDADPAAAADLAEQCVRLPLALRVAAELAAARPAVCLADLVNEMTDTRLRLDNLDASGDSRTRMRAVFSWSYHHLGADAARAFRLAGLHPGSDFDRYAVAALIDAAVEHAGQVLGLLARANLIHSLGSERYGMHDLLRAYARELAVVCDSEGERRAALTRLFDYYLYLASAAMDTLFPSERHRRPRIPEPASPTPRFTSTATARTWLDAERANLVAVAIRGWPEHATGLAATVSRYLLEVGGYFPEATSIFTHARTAARIIGDRAAEGTALINLGLVSWWYGQRQLAADRFTQALALFAAAGDVTGEARALANLGMADGTEGRLPEAAEHFGQALAIFRRIGDKTGEARALDNLGTIDMERGRLQEAAGQLRRALAIFRNVGDKTGEAYVLSKLGIIERRSRRPTQAVAYLDQALVVFREADNLAGQAYTLTALGDIDLQEGRHQQASAHHQQSLVLCRQIGNRYNESAPLSGLGEVFLATGRPEEARPQFAAAASLAAQIGDARELARAHSGLASVCRATGDLGKARDHWKQALAIYNAAGAAEADEISDALDRLEDGGVPSIWTGEA
jgi:DNA-binding SARP family transcriptional activator/Tfp pilus assembly protein PilF